MRLSSNECVLFSLLLVFDAVEGFGIPNYRRNASTSYSTAAGSNAQPNVELSSTAVQNASIYDKLPGLWFEECYDDQGTPPCTAYCHKSDTSCQTIGEAVVSSCNSMWSTYNSNKAKIVATAPGWSMAYSTYGQEISLYTTTINVYTTFSTASVAVVKQNVHTNETNLQVTITPIYALGAPSPSVSITAFSGWTSTRSWLTSPTPSCRYIDLSTTNGSGPATSNCGKCSIHGGSVELYYWPPATRTDTATSAIVTRSTVLTNGETLYSPTVYISLSTVYASNSCTGVGKNHTGTLLAMNPTDVSTQYHWGGKVAQSGANDYGRMNYADLTGLPPVTDYENQPSCIMFGCSTILPTYNPTLVVPLALRTLAPEWADCEAALEGLYDPPIALTEQAVMASPTLPSQNTLATLDPTSAPMSVPASQCSSPAVSTPTRTGGPESVTDDQAGAVASDLASLLEGTDNGARYTTTSTSTSISLSHLPYNTEHSKSGENPQQQDIPNTPETTPASSVSSSSQTSPSTDATSPNVDSTAIGGYIASVLSLVGQGTPDSILSPTNTRSEIPVSGSSRSSTVLTKNGDSHTVDEFGQTSSLTLDASEIDTGLQSPQSLTIQPHQSEFVVNGMTLAPGSPITLSNQASPMTVKMNITGGKTLIELGTTRTASLGPPETSESKTPNNSSRSEVSRSTTISSSSSSAILVVTSSREISPSSTSAAYRVSRQSAMWYVAVAAFAILLAT